MSRRLWGGVVAVSLIVVTVVVVGHDELEGVSGRFAASYALPFGLLQVPGTSPVGRPAVFDERLNDYGPSRVAPRVVLAWYEVSAADPMNVFRGWLEQLKVLHLGAVYVNNGDGRNGGWIEASGGGSELSGDRASLVLWVTNDRVFLSVEIYRFTAEGPPTVVGSIPASTPRPSGDEEGGQRFEGDALFEEQGFEMALPPGTASIGPAARGRYQVLAAKDGRTAVRSMLEDAVRGDGTKTAETVGPIHNDVDGVAIDQTKFLIGAGGWSFNAISVEGPGDPAATVYVLSVSG